MSSVEQRRRGGGRKERMVTFRVTREEYELIKDAAYYNRKAVATWVADLCLKVSKREKLKNLEEDLSKG